LSPEISLNGSRCVTNSLHEQLKYKVKQTTRRKFTTTTTTTAAATTTATTSTATLTAAKSQQYEKNVNKMIN